VALALAAELTSAADPDVPAGLGMVSPTMGTALLIGAIALAAIALMAVYARTQRRGRAHAEAALEQRRRDQRTPGPRGLEPQVADAIIDNASESIVITDAAAAVLRVNDAYCRTTGYTREEVIGKNPRILQSGRHDRSFYQDMWSTLLTEGRWVGKIWNRHKDGSIFLENLTIAAVRDAEGKTTHYLGMFTDVTYKGLDPAQISQLAFYDPLTGLATRPLLVDHLSEAVRHCKRKGGHVALFYLNLDNFSQTNQRHGHAVGDEILKAFAEHLEGIVRQNDTVARPGADEFALVLGDIASLDDVPRIADKLLQRLPEPLDYEGQTFQLNASVGIAIYPQHGEDTEQLVRLARQAMGQAKAAGKGRWTLYDAPQNGSSGG
jgi:diguanylate cyclase (GGDEF)-like protein/PAS domain S-box-containing protein